MRTSLLPMGNIDMAKDYIIDYTSNETQWYRKWKSGWIEQGGLCKSGTTVTFLIPFQTNTYNINLTNELTDGQSAIVWNRTTKNFNPRSYFQAQTYNNLNQSWYACGY